MSTDLALEEAILDTELRHINFFNGRLLTGGDLKAEQSAQHTHSWHLGMAVGAGVAFGLEVAPATDSPPGEPVLVVAKGLAVNRAGQTLRLECDQRVALIPQPDPTAADECIFNDCDPKTAGVTLKSGTGFYLLLIAAASKSEGKAPVSGLGNDLALCNSRYLSEGVKFRLLRLNVSAGTDANKVRNVVAYQCFGLPPLGPDDFVRAALTPQPAPAYGIGTLVQAGQLTEQDVPLAVIEWRANTGLGIVDLWPVRRRITRSGAAKVLGYFTDDRRRAESEAALLQFQDHAAAILEEAGVAPNLKAETRFVFLPPAGFLKIGGANFDWKNFLGAQAPENETPLDEGLVRSVVYHSLCREAVRVVGAAEAVASPPVPFHVYRVPSQPDYVLFARSSLGEVLANDVLFDNSHCKLPGVETVQDAIDALCDACRGCCTLVAHPEPGWEKIFDKIASGQDAEVCFQAGTFSVSKPVVIKGKGNLRIVGCGRATRIISGGETALHFESCASVSVSHLRAESGAIARGKPQGPNLSGALNFVNCPVVEVGHAVLICPAGTTRMAACATVRNDADAPGEACIHHCYCEVGNEQTGILLLNTIRAQVEDNVLRAGGSVAWNKQVQDLGFRARLRQNLVSQFGSGVGGPRNASVAIGTHKIAFRTPPVLAAMWQPATAAIEGANTAEGLKKALNLVADRILLGTKVPGISARVLDKLFGTVAERVVAAGSQGIVVAGRVAADVRVFHNTVTDFTQGIHVALSHEDKLRAQPDQAGTVLILDNTVRVRLTAGSTRSRHGIFAGNSDSLVIERNYVTLTRAKAAGNLPVEGIRVFGLFGRRMLVRENHCAPVADSTAFDTGIRFHALNLPDKPGTRMWIIADNVFESSPRCFDILPQQRQFLRGLDTNIS